MIIMMPTCYLTIVRCYRINIYSVQATVYIMICFIWSYKCWLNQNWDHIPSFPSLVSTARVERFIILWPNCTAFSCHSSLWPHATTFGKSYRCYLKPEVTTVCCSQMLQLLRGHREAICGLWLQWIVTTFSHDYPLCDLSNVVVSGYNKLCWSLAVKLNFIKTNQEKLARIGITAWHCFPRSMAAAVTPAAAVLGRLNNILTSIFFNCHKAKWSLCHQLPIWGI